AAGHREAGAVLREAVLDVRRVPAVAHGRRRQRRAHVLDGELAGEALAEEDPDVFVAGPAGQLADRLVAETAVERRRLIAVRVEVHLMAAAAYCLGLGRGDQARAEPVPSKRAVDPDRLHEPRAAPGPPVQARNDRSLVVAHENGERAPV